MADSIIEKIARGSDNFKALTIDKLGITVGLIILPRLVEVEMVSRARAWCRQQSPPIEDKDLIKVQEDAFLLWKSLVDPNDPWIDTAAANRIPRLLYQNPDDMERKLSGDWMDWLGEELLKFREEVSPFSAMKDFRAIDDILNKIREENKPVEKFIEAFKVVYCARHGMLPTERRVKEMLPDQWWLIWYSFTDEEKGLALQSPILKAAQ